MAFKRRAAHRGGLLVLLAVLLALTVYTADGWTGSDPVGTLGINLKHVDDYVEECSLGAAAADAARAAAGTDLALINSGDLYRNLLAGECTWEDVQSSFSQDRPLAKTSVTPAQLFELLEISVSHQVLDEEFHIEVAASSFEGFLQVSGFTFQYDMSAHAGERIYSVFLEDGTRLDPEDTETVLTLAAPAYMLSGGYGYPALPGEELGLTMAEALAEYIAAGQLTSQYAPEGRIEALGTADSTIVNRCPVLVTICILLVILIAFSMTNQRIKRVFDGFIVHRTYGTDEE